MLVFCCLSPFLCEVRPHRVGEIHLCFGPDVNASSWASLNLLILVIETMWLCIQIHLDLILLEEAMAIFSFFFFFCRQGNILCFFLNSPLVYGVSYVWRYISYQGQSVTAFILFWLDKNKRGHCSSLLTLLGGQSFSHSSFLFPFIFLPETWVFLSPV